MTISIWRGFGNLQRNRDQGLDLLLYFADFNRRDSSAVQRPPEVGGIGSGHGDQQPSGSLGVEEDRFQLIRPISVVAHHTFGEITIRQQTAWDVTGTNTIERSWEQRNTTSA